MIIITILRLLGISQISIRGINALFCLRLACQVESRGSSGVRSVIHRQFLITYIFFVSLKFRECFTTDQWGKFTVQSATFYLHIFSWILLLFFIRKLMFLSFSFLLLSEVSNKRILINQKPDLVIRNCQSNCLSAAKISKLPKLMDIKKVAFNYFANFTGKYLSLFN